MLVRLVGDGIEEWQRQFSGSKSFIRRVKRIIRAPQHLFEVIVPPQWREICCDEISSLGYTMPEKENNPGTTTNLDGSFPTSIAVHGRIWDAYRLCLWLRTASRVTVRISSFNARSKQAFRKAMESIPWEVWLNPLLPLRLYCNVEYSKLRHEGAVCEETVNAVCQRFESQGLKLSPEVVKKTWDDPMDESTSPKIRLWVNVVRNICNVSVDLTGAHLHERGYRLEPGQAPMRETLAAAILKFVKWDPVRDPFVDAMTGSGTIAIEAYLMARNVAPGLRRSFLFERLLFSTMLPGVTKKSLPNLL